MADNIILPNRSEFSTNTNKYTETVCKDCGLRQMRRRDAIKHWMGRCRKCSAKLNNSYPERVAQRTARRLQTVKLWDNAKKLAFSEKSRQQVIRQGGIPNARKFCNEGENGFRMAGPTHYAWKGGITPESLRQRRSSQYRTWRNKVLRRDNYTCQICGQQGGRLEADHIKPFSTHPELRYELSNGRILCRPCHKTTDTYCGRVFIYQKNLAKSEP